MKNKYLIILFGIVLINFVSAIPSPHGFYGNVKYSNNKSVEGEVITKIGDSIKSNSEIINGFYNLVVESEYGGLIYFYLNEENEPIGDYLFNGFETTELNFIIEVAEQSYENETEQSNLKISHQSNFVQFCDVHWECFGWSKCQNGLMTRYCYDKNNCKYPYNKPLEETSCEIISKVLVEENKSNYLFILFGTITTLILFIILISLLVRR